MIRIRLTTSFPEWPLLRQTPGSRGVWGEHSFVTSEVDDGPVDAWVVYEGLPREMTVLVPRERVLFVAGEPPSIRPYSDAFLAQFGGVITCQPAIRHPGIIHRQQAHPWHAGVENRPGGRAVARLDYDALRSHERFPKTGRISVVCSAKMQTPEHRRRRAFIERARERLGEALALFGTAYAPLDDKWDAIHPYTHHLVIENERLDDYWTEKLADAFLGLSFPIYYGCPNLEAYFPRGSFTPIDIDRPDEALDRLEAEVGRGLDPERERSLLEARRRVLDVHNLFPMLADTVAHLPAGTPRTTRLRPEGEFRRDGTARRALRRLLALTGSRDRTPDGDSS